tara:strand:+ start:58 stop:999 length:942 start_codon:yes stop_codon:yes gene_type:complete
MAHPRQLIEALMKRLLDAKKANKGKPAPDFYPYGTFVDDPKGVAVRKARQKAREAQPSDPLAKPIDMREGSRPRDPSRLPDSADARPGYRSDGTPSGGYEIDYPHDGFGARYFPEDPLNRQAVREARQRAREVQGPDRLEQPVGDTIVPGEMMESSVREPVRDPSRLPDLAPEDPLKRPVESGLSRYLPEENIHEPMMPRTRDGSVRSRDPSRLPDSESNWDRHLRIADEEKTKRMRKGTHRGTKADNLRVMEDDFISAQKEFERLAGRPPSGEEMKDIGTLEKLVDLLKDASGSGKKVSRPTLADDIDDIPF